MTGKCVGIVREVYNKWERRAPLTPAHVKDLVQRGVQVLVQPSTARVFSDEQYVRAGATLSEDLGPANVIVGVKQVPEPALLADKTYLFFSHTIKAQPENMALLDTVLQQRVTLIDYECITEESGKRLIAFGGNAGRAGMIAGFRGLGERLINMGISSPFVNVASAYMYADLEHAKDAVEAAGRMIRSDGLPGDLAPMTFAFTGNGNVSKGAQEIFKLMPHEMVHPSELPKLPKNNRILYGTVIDDPSYFVKPLPGSSGTSTRAHYYQNPHQYEAAFHEKVLPYTSMLVNCMYWDDRFPRLVTREQIRELRASDNYKLLGIADISCDIGGSVEFLERATEIERPFALYDVAEDKMREDGDSRGLEGEDGIMMMGVDILPSELARESSQQFGDRLVGYVTALSSSSSSNVPLHEQKDLPPELRGACIASKGVLAPKYEYIHRMRAERERSKQFKFLDAQQEVAGSTCILLEGHLFDTGLINQVLNLIEDHDGGFHLVDCEVRPNVGAGSGGDSTISNAIVQVSMNDREALDSIITKIRSLAELTSGAKATVTELPDLCGTDYSKTRGAVVRKDAAANTTTDVSVTSPKKRKIVCFGAGLVASPLVEYLSREQGNEVHVVSGIEDEVKGMMRKISRRNVKPHVVNVGDDSIGVDNLCAEADCVVSLLPATMHTTIAQRCIQHATPLVTASYVSPEMKRLDDKAKLAGIPILCEIGLDPGMDHMSAMKVIDEVKAHSGKIMSFSSVCGGLPAPEAADNAIGYKFSWSPRGVLTAALNAAQYRKNGKIINVAGEDLLNCSERVNFLPAFNIEQIPNRDSLPYGDIYGIPEAHSLYRGTLRYGGCCQILYQLRKLGLFDMDLSKPIPATWPDLLAQLGGHQDLREDAYGFLQWLGAFDHSIPVAKAPSILDAFCALLQDKLSYQPGERDMAIMHHEFGIEYKDGKKEKRTSTFVGYGSEKGDTIMAKTVGLSAAIGVQLILQDAVQGRGVLTPTTPDIYIPALARLEVEGVRFIEKTFPQN
ncbi:Alpha-aminoadipic semialdehyde synthase [Phytophthora palmivora]|uniref:Alpha-aminoadipic semialdehyde synthase n=2 Tax=Phytophthora palmivora TaxID=4796 RepID=A0A2P4XBP7_9STRA|nr:Alpha-aminoadipic semialdehyde synthase [Phytophthora palmivora]